MNGKYKSDHNTQQPLTADLDYYKLTMGNVILERHPAAEVTFTLKNRNHAQPLSEYVDKEQLQARLDTIRGTGFSGEEILFLAGLQSQDGDARFDQYYLDHLEHISLPPVAITLDETGDLAINTTGPWADVSLWETVVMSEVNELYYQRLMEQHGLSIDDLYEQGDRRLDEKVAKLQQYPDIKFADFGTRRRFSFGWHEHVISRLKQAMPQQFTGTSNPWFAYKYGLQPIGTFAHEMPMVYAALEDAETGRPLDGHADMLRDWQSHYDGDLSIALTDTFGSDFFFTDFDGEQAASWNGLRHDSGNPFEFAEKAIAFYQTHDIDPMTKTIVFSDGLDVDTIIQLHLYCKDRVQTTFGWGTNLMNDLGVPANNFVMKATAANGTATVKLSDDIGKHTGPQDFVDRYQLATEAMIYETA